jgi:ribonuclease P protein component
VLPAQHRLRAGADFTAVLRGRGAARAASAHIVVHAATTDPSGTRPPRVGFVVSKAVGNAVVRNRTKRRLRALAWTGRDLLRPGTDYVVRALPAAAAAGYPVLESDLRSCLSRIGARS